MSPARKMPINAADPEEFRVAILEEGVLAEVALEAASRESTETRAEVTYVSNGSGAGMDGVQRLGLKFLDAALPAALIPADARPLP